MNYLVGKGFVLGKMAWMRSPSSRSISWQPMNYEVRSQVMEKAAIGNKRLAYIILTEENFMYPVLYASSRFEESMLPVVSVRENIGGGYTFFFDTSNMRCPPTAECARFFPGGLRKQLKFFEHTKWDYQRERYCSPLDTDIKTDPLLLIHTRIQEMNQAQPTREWKFTATCHAAISFEKIAEDLSMQNPVAFVESGLEKGNSVVIYRDFWRKAEYLNRPCVDAAVGMVCLGSEMLQGGHVRIELYSRAAFSLVKAWAKQIRSARWPDDESPRNHTYTVKLLEV
jgi:hypothetical protein